MSKFDALWKYLAESGEEKLILSFDEIKEISGVPIDHSFLRFKKELTEYGYETGKISMKSKTVQFTKIK